MTDFSSMVQTPLWTDRPEKMRQFGYDPATAVLPEMVADAMLDLVTNSEYIGGDCLEVAKGGTRVLGTWNVDPPVSSGTTVPKEFITQNEGPLSSIISKEKMAKL